MVNPTGTLDLFTGSQWYRPAPLDRAVEEMGRASGEDRGATFTRPVVAQFILDLVGYTSDQDLVEQRLLEPSVGNGNFLVIALERLWSSFEARGGSPASAAEALKNCFKAVEIHGPSLEATRARLAGFLEDRCVAASHIEDLLGAWLIQDDFLLTRDLGRFTVVVGNPPYMRPERIPSKLLAYYRQQFDTMYDRADLYIPFFEKGLSLLAPSGHLGFICTNRWMKNRYGGPLRALISKDFHLESYVDMMDSDVFEGEVLTYPAITVIKRDQGEITAVARQPQIKEQELRALAQALRSPSKHKGVARLPVMGRSADPWMLGVGAELRVLRKIESQHRLIEDVGCKVGIGVATGCDRVFICPMDELPIEEDRKMPLAMAADLKNGAVEWGGLALVNPFGTDGKLINLKQYPMLGAYLEEHSEAVRGRYVAKKNPARWYRTIDSVHPGLAATPKLLIPDIKGEPVVAYDRGEFYPHHNLYFITSATWDLKALRTVLMSNIARLFIQLYSVKMKGGFLRFQAQNLRRIRLPSWSQVDVSLQEALALCPWGEVQMRDRLVGELYGLTKDDILTVL